MPNQFYVTLPRKTISTETQLTEIKMKVATNVIFHQLKDFGHKFAKLVDRSFKEKN